MTELNLSTDTPNKVTLMNGNDVVWEGTMTEYAEALEAMRAPELLMQVWRLHDGTLTAAVPFEDMEPGTYRLVKTDGS